jgi:uncharacterized protein (DUF1697 family)
MPTYVALLRAVNVGGRYYKMADLRDHLAESGLTDVETYIQTGNVRFRSAMRSPVKVEKHVESVLARHCGFDVPTILLTPAELTEVYDDALHLPAPSFADHEGLRRYVSFFKTGEAPAGEVAQRMRSWPEPGERADVVGRAVHVWLDHPTHEAGFYRTFKKALGPGTTRDLKVVTALVERWGA